MAIYNSKRYDGWMAKFYQSFVIYLLFTPIYYIFYRMKVCGKENIPKDGKPFIVMPNHLSNNDPPIVSTALMMPIAYMAKKELFSVPFIGWAITMLGAFSVDREKLEKTTLRAAKEVLSKGWCLGMFLEGKRSKTPGSLGKPNLGVPYISGLYKVPVLPIGIAGSNKPFGPITITIGKLFYPDKELEKAKWQCSEKLAELTGLKVLEH